MLAVGLDLGSVQTKAVLLDGDRVVRGSLCRRRGSDDLEALDSLILEAAPPSTAAVTGCVWNASGKLPPGVASGNSILAVAAAIHHLNPLIRSVIEIGGHTSKLIVLEADGAVRDFSTNEACAAGTGAFVDQQARRLHLDSSQLSGIALLAKRAATVAGRCSVFAASDMIHLQQKGTPLPEIAYGLCVAIARNFLATILKGREIPGPAMLAGGCGLNRGIARAFGEVLGLRAPDLEISPIPGLEGALGAALFALDSAGSLSGSLESARQSVSAIFSQRRQRRDSLPPLTRRLRAEAAAEPASPGESPLSGFIGVDAGSVSTDFVVLDEAGTVKAALYLPTRGDPARVTLEGLATLSERLGGRLRVLACGVTGSARHLAGKLLGADVVKNEITCQLLGALHYVPDAGTILEIGGQDSKFISVTGGQISDFAMNKVCAAGTGSFLEEQARDLGIDVFRDFSPRAFSALAPLDLGCRCTVFMETEVTSALSDGGSVEAISAGLAYSIARNYLERVAGTRVLGERIVFQGGVASNAAVVAAFENLLGRPVEVHPYNRISGAIGAALSARAAFEAAKGEFRTRFSGFDPVEKLELRSFECHQCANHCEVNVVETGRGKGDRAFFGDTCERYTSGGAPGSPALPNLADDYLEKVEGLFAESGGSGLLIGVPRASSLMGTLPFWATFWKELGHRPVLSRASSQETLLRGMRHLSVGVCLPVKLTAGHVSELLEGEADRVFVPAMMSLPGDDPSFTCPYTMAVPFIVGTAQTDRFLSPVVRFESEQLFATGFEPLLEILGTTREKVREAFRTGLWAQQEFDEIFRTRASVLLAARPGRRAFAVLGRPYGLLDSYLNLGLFERLRRLEVLAIPQTLLPVRQKDRPSRSPLPWRFPANMHEAALWLREQKDLSPLVLSSFGCGPDAFTLRHIEEALQSRPHLILELDEHRGEAGMLTRLEAFIDQLDGSRMPPRAAGKEPVRSAAFIPDRPSRIRIPYFADHAHAFCGLFKTRGHDAKVLPLPGTRVRALGDRYALGKECHAYSMILGDLLKLTEDEREAGQTVFFFPGTSIPCLLHEYGNGMEGILRELAIEGFRVSSPNGAQLISAFGIEAMDKFYVGLLAIEILVKAVCQIRPYECEKGRTDEVHRANLERIESAIGSGDVFTALRESLVHLEAIPVLRGAERPVVGIAGDIYTKVNPAANADLMHWLEDQGLEVWPSPFQIDVVDLGISRRLYQSATGLDLPSLLVNGSIALRRAVDLWKVRGVVGSRVTRHQEPGYLELKKLAAPYMPNESHELLFTNVAKIVDFAAGGADGIINAICFGCMIGNASAAVIEKIRRDYGDLPIITAVYSGIDDPSRRMVLDAFVSQVKNHHRRRERPRTLAERLLSHARISISPRTARQD
ncbi:MAG: hypothetical protein IT186_18930 [Acidobacteria bacterium]|nr:hypothetical protein [Acidobacteriota bacterium]